MDRAHLDSFRGALTVQRTLGVVHSVAEPVRTFIDESQRHLTLADPGTLARYDLPLDVVVELDRLAGHLQPNRMGGVGRLWAMPASTRIDAVALNLTPAAVAGEGLPAQAKLLERIAIRCDPIVLVGQLVPEQRVTIERS